MERWNIEDQFAYQTGAKCEKCYCGKIFGLNGWREGDGFQVVTVTGLPNSYPTYF